MTRPIIVTEIPRSGAQMVSHVLQASGAWCASNGDRPAYLDEPNVNAKIREIVVRPFLKGINADVFGIQTFPDLAACIQIASVIGDTWKRQVESILYAQGYNDGPWIYRGSDALMLWPLWSAAFPEARWVICRRDDAGIVRSCLRTKYIRGPENDQEFWQTWRASYKTRISTLRRIGVDVFEIWPGRFIGGKLDELERLVHALNLPWDSIIVQDALAPILWTNGVYSVEGVD